MFNVNITRHIEAEELIKSLPPEEELTARELAIHRRAHGLGYQLGERHTKQRILHNFQMSIIGHVL